MANDQISDAWEKVKTLVESMDIDIKKKALKVGVKGKAPLIDGELHQAVKIDNCFWTVGKSLQLYAYNLF
jgi:hypothetical protein